MSFTQIRKRVVAAFGLLALAVSAGAQPPQSLEAAIAENTLPIEFDSQRLTGPGAEFLVDQGSKSQFFVLGEQHYTREMPQVTTALFRMLQSEADYQFLALEQDPLMAMTVAAKPLRGDEAAILDYARRYPNAFTFETDQEIEMISEVSASSNAMANPVWGVDQIFGILHVLDFIRPCARNSTAGARIDTLVEFARPFERNRFEPGRRLIVGEGGLELPADISRLQNLIDQDSCPNEALAASQLERSIQIYAHWRAAQEGAPTKFSQNFEREENMKQLFMHFYKEAEISEEEPPKVLMKLGHQHAIRDRNWSGVLSLGDFVSSLATSRDSQSFHVSMYLNNENEGHFFLLTESQHYSPLLAAVSPGESAVIDLRSLRGRAYAGQFEGMTDRLKKVIFGFDAILLIGNGSRGSFEHSRH